MTYRTRFSFIAIALLALATSVSAYNTSLEWRTISTEHFDVHYHEGAEWTAQQVAQIAEEVYPHITGLYNYEPKRCDFVILDTQDYANGAAYFYDNKIEIWATNLEFGYRGTTQWLRNVVTHEFTHVVSIQAAMKMPRRIPALYFQIIGFEDEKRPDVITGYPNLIGSYPITGFVTPPWWAEGVAQYQSPTKQYDCWDSHRDMILRAGLIGGEMATYDEMGYLGHKSSGNEKVYDHGYGLVRFIASKYGPEAIERISESLGKIHRLTIDGALKDVTGKSGGELYEDWKNYLRIRYEEQLKPVYADPREGWLLSGDGYKTIQPSFSPDGRRVAFLSNRGSDFSGTALYVIDADGKNRKRVHGTASSRAVFSPDGSELLFAKHKRVDKWGAMKSDLSVYDFEAKKVRQITRQLRASEPQYSPDGKRIVCVINGDGTHDIATMDPHGNNLVNLYQGDKGTQIYAPQYSPDGERILFGLFSEGTRDIASIARSGGDFRYILRTMNDERDARWSPDGESIVFASDRSGIFNIYRLNLAEQTVVRLTNVVGGAFSPDASPANGSIAYAGYNAKGYNISVLDAQGEPTAAIPVSEYARRSAGELDECEPLKTRAGDMVAAAHDQGFAASSVAAAAGATLGATPQPEKSPGPGEPTPLESKDYESSFTDFQLFPRLVVWDGVPRLGAFLTSSEVLERQNVLAAGSYGTDGGYDFLVDFQLRRFFPVLYLQFFRMRQKYDDNIIADDTQFFLDVTYDLWAADFGVRFEFENIYNLVHRHDISFWFSHSEYRVHIDPLVRELADPTGAINPADPVGWRYYIGNDFFAQYYYKAIVPAVDSDINPRGGRELMLRVLYARDELFTTGEFEYGFNPKLTDNTFGQYTLDYHEYLALPWWRHSMDVRLMGSFIDNRVDDFFWIYIGGMDGIRGYTYYTLGGRAAALASATYRFPIWRRINKQFSFLTFKDVYGGVFFETANAWDHDGFQWEGYKRAAGYEARLNLGSFYAYPLTINFVGAYALDEAIYVNPLFDSEPVVNDPAWSYYTLVGFTF